MEKSDKKPKSKKKARSAGPFIALTVIFAILTVAAACAGGYLWYTGREALAEKDAALASSQERITALENDLTGLNARIDELNDSLARQSGDAATLEEERDNLNTKIETQKNEISNLNSQIADLANQVADFQDDAYRYRDVTELMYGSAIGWGGENFNSSDSVVILKTTDAPRTIILTAYWLNGGTVSYTTSSASSTLSFDTNSWDETVNVTVTPSSPGVNVVTFTNDVDSASFKILIIVTD